MSIGRIGHFVAEGIADLFLNEGFMDEHTENSNADAVVAVAKTVGKGLDAGTDLCKFLAKFVGVPLEQASGIVADRLTYLRWEGRINLAIKATTKLKELGLNTPTRALALKFALPFSRKFSEARLPDFWL